MQNHRMKSASLRILAKTHVLVDWVMRKHEANRAGHYTVEDDVGAVVVWMWVKKGWIGKDF